MFENESLFGIPLLFIGLACFVLAAVFFFVWPRAAAKPYKLISWPHYILHYFQALAWVVLGMAAVTLVRSVLGAALLFLLGIVVYGIFINALVRARRLPKQ